MGVTIVTHTHEVSTSTRRAGKTIFKPVRVGEGSWICASATILSGVENGKGCIIAAGSGVTNNCDDNCLYGGNPAKKLRGLE